MTGRLSWVLVGGGFKKVVEPNKEIPDNRQHTKMEKINPAVQRTNPNPTVAPRAENNPPEKERNNSCGQLV